MTDRRGPRRTQPTLVRGENYKFSFAIEKLSGLWQIGRSDVGIQQRGSLTPTPNRAGTRSRPNPRQPHADFDLFARSNGYPDS